MKAKGELSKLSPLRSNDSHDGQAGGWTALTVSKDTERESLYKILGIKYNRIEYFISS
jgi:hypothetical protein